MIAIISDIHGNYPALRAVLDEIDSINCQQVISLGDVAGYYCMINECVGLLRERKITHLMGNHDYYLVNNILSGRSKSADRCIAYQRGDITEENLQWLSTSPNQITISDCSFVHGGWNDYIEEYLYHLSAEYFECLDGKYFFSGHSHVQFMAQLGTKIYCNPGSVGQPRDGDPRAAYALLHDNGTIELKRVRYEIDLIASAMNSAGFESYFYENLYKGTKLDGVISKIQIVEE